ncbi:hypothetical protein HNQ93_003659 [Hymenobacter luteus]|uniref:Uncharacterized protein n=2 Tax=Hymenobacter TaxID=89966 RepID=A0A7W9T5H2_9BACT|nr:MULTISPECIES: hypothetical protein [Hymenobacter]MBB4602892.1 hypothetical protein [Hymenobacter latericoloratus]MBB6060784.1 hypothetical protein [Hymenobacter luteus]
MKHFFSLLALLLVLTTASQAQTPSAVRPVQADAIRYEFCELMRTGAVNLGKPEKEKSGDIYVDFGYGYEKLGGSEQVVREAGKIQVFATTISALNYMGSRGWEIVQILEQPINYTKGEPSEYVRRYVLRRPLSAKGVAGPR